MNKIKNKKHMIFLEKSLTNSTLINYKHSYHMKTKFQIFKLIRIAYQNTTIYM